MKLARELHIARWILVFGIIEMSLLAEYLPAGPIVALGAYLCFLLLIIVYLFDIIYHRVGNK